MNIISFTIPVCPASLQFSGRRVMVKNGRPVFFKQKKASDWEKIVGWYSTPYRPATPFTGPLRMSVVFVLKRPVALNAKKFTRDRIPCPKRPDLDNLQKNLQDSVKGFWEDDSQIVSLFLKKVYAATDETPKIEISISQYEDEH
jgi:Holliday junction resolvase RusA-like endonuclease